MIRLVVRARPGNVVCSWMGMGPVVEAYPWVESWSMTGLGSTDKNGWVLTEIGSEALSELGQVSRIWWTDSKPRFNVMGWSLAIA
jgi:hypothetical protein